MRPGPPARTASLILGMAIGLSLTLSDCRGQNHRASSSAKNASAAQPAGSTAVGDCDNPFFPAIPDATLAYESTVNNNPGYTYSVTFTDISEGSFVEHQEASDEVSLDLTWKCQGDGLISTEYSDLSRPESRLKFETLDSTGVTIPVPNRWQKGTKWNYGYKVRGQMSFMGAPKPVDVEGTITVAAEIGAQERVNVPAGVYQAVRVQSVYDEALTMKGNPSRPIDMTFTVQSWYAKDIGLVKTASEDLRVITVLKSVTK